MRNHGNGNLFTSVSEERLRLMEEAASSHIANLFDTLLIDWPNDHNMHDTPRRVAKMLVQEIFAGRYQPMPKVTTFPNAENLDELYTTGPITVRSTCSHHLMPIYGQCWIGIIPGDRVMGLSKFNRLVDWICRRPQIQEEMTVQIADLIERLMSPLALGVVVRAKHMCMTHRGVNEHGAAEMTTSVMRGKLRESAAARAEFFSLIK